MQTFPYTKPLSAASERECFLHVSLLRSKPLARFLLYAISSMPRFSTFHNKSLDRINCRLGKDGKALFTKAENKPQGTAGAKTSLAVLCHLFTASLHVEREQTMLTSECLPLLRAESVTIAMRGCTRDS